MSRSEALHSLSEAVSVLLLGVAALRAHVADPDGLVILADLEDACERCGPLFDRLRRA